METVSKSLNTIETSLGSMNTSLTTKIEEGNSKLADDFKRLENTLNSEVNNLKVADDEIRNELRAQKIDTDQKLGEFRVAMDDLANRIPDQGELDAANVVIKDQAARILSLEKQCHRGLQHGRGWNVEIDGIPKEVGDDPENLRHAVLELFSAFYISVQDIDIETIHRLPSRYSPKPVIVRFISRESVREIHHKKSRLKNLSERIGDIEMDGLTEDSKIFIRASQCAYYRNLAFNCRVLKRKGMVSSVKVGDDGKVSIKLLDITLVKVSHETTLLKHFPNFDGFNFDYDEKERDE